MKTLNPAFLVQRSTERACFNHGWLKTCHSFSFADYYDPENVQWGALRVFNDDVVAPAEGFPTHPHRDMEIITYVLDGSLEHRDSTGSHGIVGPGGAQFMSAGTGVRHSEFNHSQTEQLHFLQMWILPGQRGTPPSYGQVEFKPADRQNRWLAVASGTRSVAAPVKLAQDAAFFATQLDGSRTLEHDFGTNRFGFIFVADGELVADGFAAENSIGSETLRTGDALRLSHLDRLDLGGSGLAVLWDLPQAAQ
jgi:quercetin 2,3-dioxygenase